MQTDAATASAPATNNRAQLAETRGPMARDLLLELFKHLDMPVEVTLRPGGDDIALHAKVGDGAEAVGLGGERPALQEPIAYLLSKMVNRGLPDGGPRAFVRLSFGDAPPSASAPVVEETDPEVVALGKALAARAAALGKTLTVGPMSARERRSLHIAVKEVGGATTRSEGEGLLRRVLIVPATPAAESPNARGET